MRVALATLRIGASAALLWLLFRWLDGGAVLARLTELRPGWVALALLVTVVQVAVLAWRWRLTAARLGAELSLGDAVREYWLGILVNQLLPGGVLGDVSRAWRHTRTGAPRGAAVRAVILERVSAQVVMTLTAMVSVVWLASPGFLALLALAAPAAFVTVAIRARVHVPEQAIAAPGTAIGRLLADAQRALLAREVIVPQLLTALAVVASYILVFVLAARAVGVTTPLVTLLPLVAPVLMTMLVPVTVAGWGIREAAAAALWLWMGLTPEEGATVSVAYGLIMLASSAPAIVPLIATLAGRGRTARPPRG